MEILNPQEKILVIQTAFVGDAVLTLPFLQELKKLYQSSAIDVISTPISKEIFASCPVVNEVIVLDKRKEHKSFFKLISFSKEIKRRNYTRLYSPHRSLRTCLIVLWTGIRETYGFSNSTLPFVFKNVFQYKLSSHEVQRDLALTGEKKYEDNWHLLPEINASDERKSEVKTFVESLDNKNLVAVAPGAIWETKKYPIEYYEEIIKYIIRIGNSVVLIGSKADEDLCKSIKSKFEKRVFSSAGMFPVPGTVELLRHCKLLISNDSAPTHFGMAADIPVITIYCSTIPAFGFYPYNKNSFSISFDDLDCKPCGIHGHKTCPIKTFDCAHKIDIDEIKNRIEKILNGK